jgi:CheY-like chemotaxis protein
VSRYVCDTLQVSPIKLLWTIYLELSKVIDVYRTKQVVILIDSQREEGSVRQVLSVKFYFVESLSGVIEDLDKRAWSEEKEVNYCYAHLIFNGNVPAKYTIAKDPDGDIRYTLSLTIRAASSQTMTMPLADKTYLLCGSSSLQYDIIDKTIRQAGGEVVYLPTPTSAFHTVPMYPHAAGVIVTDTIAGIELKSFLKTLSSRMKRAKLPPKLILSLSSKKFDVETTDFVDQVVLRPTSPISFVNALVSVLPDSDEDGSADAAKIICVDDDMTHGFILSEILEAGGWPAEHHDNSREAVEYITSHPTKIVFMDCIMPELNGFEATRMIRAHEAENNIKQAITIIGATGLTSVSEMNDCIEAGMDYVINKPYSQEEILRVLKTYSAARKVV